MHGRALGRFVQLIGQRSSGDDKAGGPGSDVLRWRDDIRFEPDRFSQGFGLLLRHGEFITAARFTNKLFTTAFRRDQSAGLQ